MMERYKTLPLGADNFKIPTSSRSAALAGLSLYAACKPRGLWALRAAWITIELFGPGALPGRPTAWQPPMDEDVWSALASAWRAQAGDFDTLAVYQRRQASRPGLALLLLRRGTPVAFVKIRSDGVESLWDEARAQRAVWNFKPRSFGVPEPIACGEVERWRYFITVALPPGPHFPPDDPPLDSILQETEAALADLPRPAGMPAHWRPMHGDFAPWNLRRVGRTALVLIDWERAGWGPPHADAVLYRATEAALRGRAVGSCAHTEAVQFWMRQVRSRPKTDQDSNFTAALERTLQRMGASG
jgi:hypothetical protein